MDSSLLLLSDFYPTSENGWYVMTYWELTGLLPGVWWDWPLLLEGELMGLTRRVDLWCWAISPDFLRQVFTGSGQCVV
jgi:hypothetical protein